MTVKAMELFEDHDQDRVKRELPPLARLFLEEVNEAANWYGIPGYTMIVLVPELITASVGGYSEVACDLLAQANVQMAEKIRQLMALQMTEHHGKPS